MKFLLTIFVYLLFFNSLFAQTKSELNEIMLRKKADLLAQKIIIVDTHIDVPDFLHDDYSDISQRTKSGDFDYPRAKEGGLNAPFMSIYTSTSAAEKGISKSLADTLIDMVYDFVKKWPDKFVIATSSDDVRKQFGSGKISFPIGMENGSPIEDDLNNVKYFFDRGVRYITLCHYKDNQICDSSNDPNKKWNGLSPFGEKVVAEMNRLGIMVDISHVSDSTFYDVIKMSKAPIIASHSACRYFTPGWHRNMSDEMIKTLGKHGGVININFGSTFVSRKIFERQNEGRLKINKYIKEHNLDYNSKEARDYRKNYWKENPLYAEVSDVANNIDRAVKLAGIDHVGIGSDFDGLGDELPYGLKDVSQYPNLIYELLKRGYSDEEIKKIFGKNLLNVWIKVEIAAKQIQEKSK